MRISEPDKGLDYKTLFDSAIRLAQTLASDDWTDYNEHDPGVTILQQLCYALTDLAYRAGYDDADLLTPTKADESDTTFFTGPEILTCAPVTEHDFRNLLYAQIIPVENAWLRMSLDQRKLQGLYDIDVQAYDYVADEASIESLRQKVLSTYLARRPLCEDVVHIKILKPLNVTVAADIEIDDSQPPNDIAANIIFSLQQNLVAAPAYASIKSERAAGRSYDEIFEGPALDAVINNNTPDQRRHSLPIAQFLKIARSADGVEMLRKLQVETAGASAPVSSILEWDLDRFPTIDAKATLSNQIGTRPDFILRRGSVPQALESDRVIDNITHLKYMDHEGVLATIRAVRSDPYNALPRGISRSPEVYTTIREQFPMVYGLGPYGIPDVFVAQGNQSANQPEKRSARVKQLKAYLLIFEQLMTNHLAQLANLPELFSLKETASERTYYSQLIETPEIQGSLSIDDVLPAEKAFSVASLVKQQDRPLDRRERLLNHLLARFNESFDDARWTRAWEVGCRTAADANEMIRRRNAAKTSFLADYVFVGGFRGAGIDYAQSMPAPPLHDVLVAVGQAGESQDDSLTKFKRTDEAAGIERRVKLLTGVDELFVIEHILLRNRADESDFALADFYSLKLSVIVAYTSTDQQQQATRSFIERTVEDNCPAHIESNCLFLEDSDMQRFRTSYLAWREAYAKLFSSGGEATPAAKADLDRCSQELRTLLMNWDEQNEGLARK